jgi:hypothetical protein
VPIIDCGIPVAADDAAYREGMAAGVFIKDSSGKPYLGQVCGMEPCELLTAIVAVVAPRTCMTQR